jgi:hypothetical protein
MRATVYTALQEEKTRAGLIHPANRNYSEKDYIPID